MRATVPQDRPPGDTNRRAAWGDAALAVTMGLLRAVLAAARLALVSVLAVIGAFLALAPVALRPRPRGRRLEPLPSARSVAALPRTLGGVLERGGEVLRR